MLNKSVAIGGLCLLIGACASQKQNENGPFAMADRNHDGYVSHDEWTASGGNDLAFLAIDRDRKGRLNESQFHEAKRLGERDKSSVESQRAAVDGDIKQRVKAALGANNGVNAWALQTDVFQGAVTLSGNVRTEKEKKLAEDIAGGVSGVSQVFNNITLKY